MVPEGTPSATPSAPSAPAASSAPATTSPSPSTPAASSSSTPSTSPSAGQGKSPEGQPNSGGVGEASTKSSTPQETAAAQAEARRLLKLQVDGEEIEYDLSNEDQVKRDIQMARAATKRMQEAAATTKRFGQIVEALKGGRFDLLEKLGVPKETMRAAMERQLASQIEEEMIEQLPPEQKRQMLEERARARDAEQWRAYQAKLKRQADLKRQETEQRARDERLAGKFEEAITLGELPKTPTVMALMHRIEWLAEQQGIDVTPEKLAEVVSANLYADQDHYFADPKRLGKILERHRARLEGLDADTLAGLLGDNVAGKFREVELKRHQARDAASGRFTSSSTPASAAGGGNSETKQVLSRSQFLEQMRKGFV